MVIKARWAELDHIALDPGILAEIDPDEVDPAPDSPVEVEDEDEDEDEEHEQEEVTNDAG